MSRIAALTPTYQDVATYLPRKPIQEFARKHTIYDPGQPCNNLYLVRSGRVVINNSFVGGSPVVTRIVGPNGIFGEGLLIGSDEQSESAVVLDQARVMSWGRAEVEQLVSRDPRLGLALLAYFVKRCSELNERLEALAFRKTPERVMLGLLQLAETLGTPSNGGMRLAPLTHQAIAEYVGTSREIVTSHMSDLRRAGMLQYSRKFIEVNVVAMRETLRQQGIEVHPAETPMARAAF
jgi:CRP/FNR family transcriptional regulator